MELLQKILSRILRWVLANPFQVVVGILIAYTSSLIWTGLSASQILFAFVIGFVVASIIKRPRFRKRKNKKRKDIGEGQATSYWSDEDDVEALDLFGTEGLLLGRFTRSRGNSILARLIQSKTPQPSLLKFNQNEPGKEGNLLTVAPPGAGKGAGIVIPNLLTYPGSVVVTDPKGENFGVTGLARRRMGQAVFCLDPFNVCRSKNRAKLNPLDLLDPSSDDIIDDARVLADTLILRSGQEKDSDKFFNDMAVALLQGLILYVACEAPEEIRHLGQVRKFLTETPGEMEFTLDMMESSEKAHGLIARAATKFRGLGPKVGTDVLSTAISNTEFLDSPKVVQSLSKSSFDIRDLKRTGNLSIYLVLPIDKLSAYSRLLRLWVATTMQTMVRVPGKPTHRVLFMLDEMAQLGPMESLREAASIIRGYGGTIWTILQDLSQIKALYPDNKWQPFVSSSTVQQYFGVSDLETAKYVSELLGNTTIEVTSTNQGESTTPGQFGGRSTNTGETVTEQIRPLLRPEEVLRMSKSEQIIYIRGEAPIRAKKVEYYKDSDFAGMYDQNPQHQSI